MADPYDDEDDAPLDPAVAQVQSRLRRLMLIAGLTLGLGIFAVFAAIMYRLTAGDTAPSAVTPDTATPTLARSAMGVPPEAQLIATDLDGDRLAITFEDVGGETVVIVHLPSMTVVERLRIAEE